MEITLKIDGKDKTFKQEKVTFQTMRKAMDYQERLLEQYEAIEQLAMKEIDDDIDYEEYETDPKEDAEAAADLIVGFFDGQFTHDDFINGAYFGDITELYGTAQTIMFEVLQPKTEETDSKKAKRQQKKSV